MTSPSFRDRGHAGRILAERLARLNPQNPSVVALPRGGVPIGAEIARALGAPLEVLVVRKIGAPGNPEYGIGAIAENGAYWLNEEAVATVGATPSELRASLEAEAHELERRVRVYRGGRPLPRFEGRTAILVDDGLATGVTALVAAQQLRRQGAERLILAVPVGARESVELLRPLVDEVVCLETPERFFSVGTWYHDFSQLTDAEVVSFLEEASAAERSTWPSWSSALSLPRQGRMRGVILFAHGAGSSRLSPRNRMVARALEREGFGTMLFDLLRPEEAADRARVFDIPLLADRLLQATRWVRAQPACRGLPIGYFGASTGAAAALWAAAELGGAIGAVVSRGGRPDLAGSRLGRVKAPTLLLVGGEDAPVIELNRVALARLRDARLRVIPGATHLFEEPGALEAVAREAAEWFAVHLAEERLSPPADHARRQDDAA